MSAWDDNRIGTDDHNGRNYRIRVTKTECAKTRMKKHIKPTNILAEDYLQKDMTKANLILAPDSLDEEIHHFMQIHKDDHFNKTEAEEKDSIRNTSHTRQLNADVYTESMDISGQSGKGTSDKHECSTKTQN